MQVKIASHKIWSDSKIVKPKYLKSGKLVSRISFLPGKCKIQFYLCPWDIIVYHRDFFSPRISKERAIGQDVFELASDDDYFEDGDGMIVLRNEAYITFKFNAYEDWYAVNSPQAMLLNLAKKYGDLVGLSEYDIMSDYYHRSLLEEVLKINKEKGIFNVESTSFLGQGRAKMEQEWIRRSFMMESNGYHGRSKKKVNRRRTELSNKRSRSDETITRPIRRRRSRNI